MRKTSQNTSIYDGSRRIKGKGTVATTDLINVTRRGRGMMAEAVMQSKRVAVALLFLVFRSVRERGGKGEGEGEEIGEVFDFIGDFICR